jgi:hypothetical protein
MRTIKLSALLSTLLLLILANTTASGQPTDSTLAAPAPLVDAAEKVKTSSEALLRLQTDELKKTTEQVELLRQLYSEGLIAKVELDEGEQALVEATAKLAATQNQVSGSKKLISDIKKAEELAKSQPVKSPAGLVKPTLWTRSPVGPLGISPTATILRSSGAGASWSLASLSSVQQFFSANFGYALPTSAVGQSATHNRLGYDHRNAVDVALHPDSAEGRALINYLQSHGVPFLAFRAAVPGVATGPHIHIGTPSHRLA